MGIEASSAENEGERREGLARLGRSGDIVMEGGRKGDGRPIGDGLPRLGLLGGDRLGRPEEDRFGLARPGLARPGRPSDARG